MLAGRYPSDEFAELRPRVVWDRSAGTVRGRDGARSLAVQNAGTIPDRGLYAVVLPDGAPGGRAGRGDGLRGAHGPDLHARRLHVAHRGDHPRPGGRDPGPGAPGAVPFWKGEGVGRPYELGEAVGGWRASWWPPARAGGRAAARRERASTGAPRPTWSPTSRTRPRPPGPCPSDRAIVVERFRDEIGDWRLCVLTPFGARVHAPWAMALGARLRAATGQEAHAIWGDDGIALHLPDADEAPPSDLALIDPDEIEELVLGELGGTALFGARFRENAARALLIPRRRPGHRTPLWQQRLKASSPARRWRAGSAASPSSSRPTASACDDWFDLPALRAVLGRVRVARARAWWRWRPPTASPFAGSLLFEYVASYMYEDDAPAAERRAQALSLNRDLLRELLGPGGAARPHRRRRAGRAGGGPPGPVRARPRPRRRRAARSAAPHRRPLGGRDRPPAGRSADARRTCCAS